MKQIVRILCCYLLYSQCLANSAPEVTVQLGPRPFYLLDQLQSGPLKEKLEQCRQGPFATSDFSIAHRGASLQFPEHTKEAYIAAAQMGAGIIECDVTFTKDRHLVCRHAQCDLHRTTNILENPTLAKKCTRPFQAADSDNKASAQCCTSDITLSEFKSLQGKMDAANPKAKTIEEYLAATPNWRTDLYASTGTLMSFDESIELMQSLNLKMTPELKAPAVKMPFQGEYRQSDYAQAMIDRLIHFEVKPSDVLVQSFSWNDIAYWIRNEPEFARQAVFLDDRVDTEDLYQDAIASLPTLKQQGLNIVAPPLWALLSLDQNNNIVPSPYAKAAKNAGLKIITWTLERSGHITQSEDYYYQSVLPALKTEGDIFKVLEVLHKDIGVIGVFADWPAAVTYYANCNGL